jgi:hypothetical protein
MPISQVLQGGDVAMSDAQLLKYYLKITVQPEAGGASVHKRWRTLLGNIPHSTGLV